jgi:hypothetical protein
MAHQKGIMPLKGTIGNISFYKSKHGYLAREKGGVDGNRIATDPRFQRTRENNQEFGRAGKAGKVLRDAFRQLLQKASDSSMVARLTTLMLQVIKLDSTSTRGLRNVLDGELELLQGFEANAGSVLSALFYAPFTAVINRVTGELKIDIAPFVPATMIAAPQGATHFRIYAGGAAINFESSTIESGMDDGGNLPINNQLTAAINLSIALSANSTVPLFIGMAVEFLQEVNTVFYPMKNGSFNAMSFVKVEGV